MPTNRQIRKLQKEKNRIPGGNELKPGSRRKQEPSYWEGVHTPPSIWNRTDRFRTTLGTAWGIARSKKGNRNDTTR